MTQYDNTNKGGLWAAKAHSGNANVAGAEFYADLVATNAKSDKAPTAMLYLRGKEGSHIVALFKPNREAKYVLSGKDDDLRVRVFVYRGKSDNSKAPVFNLSFLDFDNQDADRPQERRQQTRQDDGYGGAGDFYDNDSSGNEEVPF
jgi:hypothetical protein